MTESSEERLYALVPGGALRLDPGERSPSEALLGLRPGVYEGLRTFQRSRFFGLRAHLERLRRAVERFPERLEFDEDACARAIEAAAADATDTFGGDVRVRLDVLPEPAVSLGTGSNVLLAVARWTGVPARILEHGARLGLARGLERRDPPAKTADFIGARGRWIEERGVEGVDEYVLVGEREGREVVLEGALSNLAFVRGSELLRAPSGVLPGVTMRAACDLARAAGLSVVDAWVPVHDLARFDGAFFTTSVRGVVPVRSIEDTDFGPPGATVRRLAALYDGLTLEDACAPGERARARY
ncbi:MAG: aminotransferase class IV [Planctomycetota bacterium]